MPKTPIIDEKSLELATPGCLGTCWYGKYHYVEPWVGCEHDCHYCYARYRSNVVAALAERQTTFCRPRPFYPPDELIARLRQRLSKGDIHIVKLSRFTDPLQPEFVESGLAAEVLETLALSPAERIIITTKGIPDDRILELMARHCAKFSYNAVAKPDSGVYLENCAPPVEERLRAAVAVQRSGVRTTIHMDPLAPGLEDDPAELEKFLNNLKSLGLNRVMFSLLLLSDEMVADVATRLCQPECERLLAGFDRASERQYLKNQSDTCYFAARPDAARRCIEIVSSKLRELSFEFVLCSLKNVGEGFKVDRNECPRCDGTFYA
jgi:DNA repair photolyase